MFLPRSVIFPWKIDPFFLDQAPSAASSSTPKEKKRSKEGKTNFIR